MGHPNLNWVQWVIPFTLHMFGKFPEINRNYLQGVAFTMFKVFSEFLDSKDAILLVTFNDELD